MSRKDGSKEKYAEILEYSLSTIDAKVPTVDLRVIRAWFNEFDHRSFQMNEEVNSGLLDRELARMVEINLVEDLKRSRPFTPICSANGPCWVRWKRPSKNCLS